MKTKVILPVLILILVAMVGFLIFSNGNDQPNNSAQTADNVSIVDGKQIITINVKGGYSPKSTNAKADLPTQIKLKTNGTFDCSSSIVIQSLGYRNNLSPSGETMVDVPAQTKGSTLRGSCSMGMYNFNISFN